MDVSGTIGAILSQKSKDIFSIRSDALVSEAIEMMDEKNVGALLVMDGDELNGIISERDYTRKVFLRGKRSRETKVSEIMSTNVTVTQQGKSVAGRRVARGSRSSSRHGTTTSRRFSRRRLFAPRDLSASSR